MLMQKEAVWAGEVLFGVTQAADPLLTIETWKSFTAPPRRDRLVCIERSRPLLIGWYMICVQDSKPVWASSKAPLVADDLFVTSLLTCHVPLMKANNYTLNIVDVCSVRLWNCCRPRSVMCCDLTRLSAAIVQAGLLFDCMFSTGCDTTLVILLNFSF